MATIGDISSTVFRGLNIGVLAGVSGNVMRLMDRAFYSPRRRRKRKSKRRKKRR